MKSSRILKLCGIAVIFSLLAVAVMALPAMAASISLSRTSGNTGASVTVTGLDFTTYATTVNFEYWAEIYFAKDSATVNSGNIDTDIQTYELVGESDDPIDENGDFVASFSVPTRLTGYAGTAYDEDVAAGTYYVYVTIRRIDQVTSDELYYTTVRGKATFTVTGGVGILDPISPTSGKAGTDVIVSGSGFTASSVITFRFDSTTLTVKSGDSATRTSGIFISTLTIPATATTGTHSISVTVSGTTVSATYTVTASAALDPLVPTTGAAGSDVGISGANFPASTALVFKFDTTTLTPKSGTDATTRASGVFISTITIPASATAGAHTITVTAGTSTASATFTVTASAALNSLVPATGAAGTDVTVTGANFLASYPIIFKFDTTTLTPKAGDVNTNTAGSFNSILTIPASAAAGAHNISVTVGTVTLTAVFTVEGTQPPPTTPPPTGNAVLSINTSGDAIGSQIGIGGAGFTPGATVTFKYDNVTVATATADSTGLVTTIFLAPPSMHGEHIITVSDGTKSATTKYTVEAEAPPAPPLVLPEDGDKVESPITFDWTDVEDDSAPVTYDFQIAIDKDFDANSIVLEETALKDSKFTYKESATLKLEMQEEPYYWRVRAVDAAVNQSKWSDNREFLISPPFSFPKWALYLIIGVAALLLFVIGFWIGRRTAFYY